MTLPDFQRMPGPSRNVFVAGQDGNMSVELGNSASIDAFGRLRVANPAAIFDSQLQYDKQPFLWVEKEVGTTTITHLPNESAVDLTLGTASGDRIVRQTQTASQPHSRSTGRRCDNGKART